MEKLIAELIEVKVDELERPTALPNLKEPKNSGVNSRIFLSSAQCMGDDEKFLFAFGGES